MNIPFICFYAYFVIKWIRSVTQQNFDMQEEAFNFSTHISRYLDKYGFFVSCGIWWKTSVCWVELPVHVHKLGRSLEFFRLGNPYYQTYLFKSAMVWIFISLIFSSPCVPIPISLPTDTQSHILSVLIFLTHVEDKEVRFLIIANSLQISFL